MSKLPSFVAPVKNSLDVANSQSSSAAPKSSQNSNESDKKKALFSLKDMQPSVNFSTEMEGDPFICKNIASISKLKKTLENVKGKQNKRQAKSLDISQKKLKTDKKVAENNKITLEREPKGKKLKEKKVLSKGKKMESEFEKVKTGINSNENLIEKSKPINNLTVRKEENKPKQLTFTSQETSSQQMSQTSNSFMQMSLSQPPKALSFKDKLRWLQERRQVGIWVECCHKDCKKFRYLPDVHDPLQLPAIWYCNMNSDTKANCCSKAEYKLNVSQEEDLIHALYSAGSLVWAQLEGYPWWPAMVDDCADTEQYYWLDGFSDIPNYYNVTFLDAAKVTRAWVAPNKLRPYFARGKIVQYQQQKVPVDFQRRINTAIEQANEASKLPILERLRKYSFIARYKGPINSPKKIHGLKRYSSKYHDLSSRSSDSSSSDSEDNSKSEERAKKVTGRKPKAAISQNLVEERHFGKPISNKGKKPTLTEETVKLTDNMVDKENAATSIRHSVDSNITIIQESEAVTWKDNASILRQNSASGLVNVSEEIPIQSQIVYKKSAKKPVLSQDEENNKSLNSEGILTHSQSCVDVTDVATPNISETQNGETLETVDSIFQNLFGSDAVVPSTETDVINLHLEESDMSDESDKNSNKSLNFEMY